MKSKKIHYSYKAMGTPAEFVFGMIGFILIIGAIEFFPLLALGLTPNIFQKHWIVSTGFAILIALAGTKLIILADQKNYNRTFKLLGKNRKQKEIKKK